VTQLAEGFPTLDPAIRDLWHVVGAVEDYPAGRTVETVLFGARLLVTGGTAPSARAKSAALPVMERYGYLWVAPGMPTRDLFPIPEYAEAGRCNVSAATFRVAVSAPRAIENFLDMGHFPFVHTGWLGEEPHTEVKDYDVEISAERDEILATRCRFFQPKPGPTAEGGFDIEYVYRVPHPYCAVLYKSSQDDPARMDVIAMFAQPVAEDMCIAHTMVSMVAPPEGAAGIRRFQHIIFGQDKPILENQVPKRLPLDPRAETPIRADKAGIAYRRWLRAKGVRYGTIPSAA
jgi:phenylpropionate dioxygenase-like ring-hydroxylating dioxygenase large terminal subunit